MSQNSSAPPYLRNSNFNTNRNKLENNLLKYSNQMESINNGLKKMIGNVKNLSSNGIKKIGELSLFNKILILTIIFIFISGFIISFITEKNKPTDYLAIYYENGVECDDPSGNPRIFNNQKLNEVGEGIEFTYSVNLFIRQWYTGPFRNKWKNILRKGNTGIAGLSNWCSYSEQCPGIYFGDKVNDLRMVFTTYGDDNFLQLEYCDIKDIPINTQFNLIITISSNILTIYINGLLIRTCVFKGRIKTNTSPINFNSPLGFDGYIEKIMYFNRALTLDEIEAIGNDYNFRIYVRCQASVQANSLKLMGK